MNNCQGNINWKWTCVKSCRFFCSFDNVLKGFGLKKASVCNNNIKFKSSRVNSEFPVVLRGQYTKIMSRRKWNLQMMLSLAAWFYNLLIRETEFYSGNSLLLLLKFLTKSLNNSVRFHLGSTDHSRVAKHVDIGKSEANSRFKERVERQIKKSMQFLNYCIFWRFFFLIQKWTDISNCSF